jgi:hypothetical protein
MDIAIHAFRIKKSGKPEEIGDGTGSGSTCAVINFIVWTKLFPAGGFRSIISKGCLPGHRLNRTQSA